MSRPMDTSSTTRMAEIPGQTLKIQWFFLNEICTGTHLRHSYGKDNWRKFCWKLDGEKYQIWNVCLFIENKDYSYRYPWDDIKMAGKKQNMAPMWKKLGKNVDLDEPTSFLDHVFLGCIQRECKSNESMFEEHKSCSNHVFLRHGRTCSKLRWAILRVGKQKVEQFFKLSSPCLDDHQFEQEELESVGELSQVCSHIVLTCLYVARIGRPEIPWSVNKLARAITKWTQACDRRLARLFLSYIHHTNDFGNPNQWFQRRRDRST